MFGFDAQQFSDNVRRIKEILHETDLTFFFNTQQKEMKENETSGGSLLMSEYTLV